MFIIEKEDDLEEEEVPRRDFDEDNSSPDKDLEIVRVFLLLLLVFDAVRDVVGIFVLDLEKVLDLDFVMDGVGTFVFDPVRLLDFDFVLNDSEDVCDDEL